MELCINDLNLVMTDNWFELIEGVELEMHQETIVMKPYQTLWLTNRITN